MLGITGALGLLTQVGGTIWGAAQSKKYADRARADEQKGFSQSDAWYNRQISADYTQRPDIQAVLAKNRDLLNEQYRRARANNIVGGGTDESLAMQKALANQSLAETTRDVASNAANYNESMEQGKLANQQRHTQNLIANNDRQAQFNALAGGQLAQAGGELIDADNGSWDWLLRRRRNQDSQGESKG